MNGFKFIAATKKLGKKYKYCPICKKETELEMKNERILIDCQCGLSIIADENAKILKEHWIHEGNTYCAKCGDKVEGGYCGCRGKE